MKLDFNFESGLERLTEEKNARNSNGSNHLPNKSINIARSMEVSNNGSPVGVVSPISPSTDDLNLKIQSVKKVCRSVFRFLIVFTKFFFFKML